MGEAKKFDKGRTAYEAGDYRTEIQELKLLAEQGNLEAQYNLGMMCDFGEGILPDYSGSIKWYKMAATLGDSEIQYILGMKYEGCWKGLQNIIPTLMWFNIASANGNKYAASARNKLAEKMSISDLSEAQRRAQVCIASGYRDCD